MSDLDRQIEIKVAAEVEKQLSRERVILKEAGGIAIKIIAGSFILLFAIFTVFGLTTWKDVKKETSEFIKSRADELIQKSDSDTGVKQTLNNLVNRAIVTSELLALKREGGTLSELPQSEWDRLRNWLKVETLDVQEFTDALTILNAQKSDRKKADANTLLSEMLSPPDGSPYQWIRKQPDKRMAIMSTFEQLDMGGSAVEIALSSNVSEETRVAAIKYLRSIRYVEGFDKILRLTSSAEEGDLKREALITSAVLRPTDARLSTAIEKLTGQANPRSGVVRTAADIVREVWKSKYDQEGQVELVDATKKLLEFAFKHGIYLVEDDRRSFPFRGDRSEALTRSSAEVVLWIPTGGGRASGFTLGDVKQFNELKPYWELLSEAASQNDVSKLGRLMLRSGGFRSSSSLSIQIELPKASAIIVGTAGGEKTTLYGADVSRARLMPRSRGDGPIQVSWIDSEKRVLRESLLGFSGAGFKFSCSPLSSSSAE